MSTFLYFVLPRTSTGTGIVMLCGVFFWQICIDAYNTPYTHWCQNTKCGCKRNKYRPLNQKQSKCKCFVEIILENKSAKVFAIFLQFLGLATFVAGSIIANKNMYTIAMTTSYVVIVLILSFVWSDWYQRNISEPFTMLQDGNVTARYKSCK